MAGTILSVNDLDKRYISDSIFRGLTFQLSDGGRVGVVGPNGVGKSTLLKIIAGLEAPSGGTVAVSRGSRVTYLPQEARFESDRTVREEALLAFERLHALSDEMRALEHALGTTADDTELERIMAEYDAASLAFETGGGYDIEHRTDAVLHGLGFDEENWNLRVPSLSGGQKTRVALAKALLAAPDLLLLDEPTNHLDLTALEWLEDFLRSWRGTYIVVSHDRYFLDRVTTRTLDLAFGLLEDYPAGYGRYLVLREERLARRMKEYEAQQEYIARTEEFIRRYRAGQRAREAKGRETRLARLDRIQRPQEHEKLKLAINADLRTGRVVLRTDKLTVGYGVGASETALLSTPELEILSGDRVALIGPNGGGKTTLLRTLMGDLAPLRGTSRFGVNVQPAYYAQGHEGLTFERTVLETILEAFPMTEESARTFLGRFLFSDDDVFKQVSVLSGGERSRLALAKLTLARANFLILDEPTNHLDIAAREALEGVLDEYSGTLLFVSHDRYFIDRLATQVWAIGPEGKIVPYLGNYSDYLVKLRRDNAPDPTAASNGKENPKQARPSVEERSSLPSRRERGSLERQLREQRKQLAEIEKQIGRCEERLTEIDSELTGASASGAVEEIGRLGQEFERLHEQLEGLYSRWNEVTAELDVLAVAGA